MDTEKRSDSKATSPSREHTVVSDPIGSQKSNIELGNLDQLIIIEQGEEQVETSSDFSSHRYRVYDYPGTVTTYTSHYSPYIIHSSKPVSKWVTAHQPRIYVDLYISLYIFVLSYQ